MKALRRTLMFGCVVSTALGHASGRSVSIVEITARDMSEASASVPSTSEHATPTDGGAPHERRQVLYASADRRFTVTVSWTDFASRELTHSRTDEFVYVVDGTVEIAGRSRAPRSFGPGDAFVLPRRFSGTWRQQSPVKAVVVSYVSRAATDAAATGSPAAVVAVERRLLDAAGWTPVGDAPFARVTSGEQPKYRSAVAFTSTDHRWMVDVSSYEVMSLETREWPIDEFMYFLEGEVEIRDAAGRGRVYGPGDSIAAARGWTGTWKQISPVTKISVSYDASEHAQ